MKINCFKATLQSNCFVLPWIQATSKLKTAFFVDRKNQDSKSFFVFQPSLSGVIKDWSAYLFSCNTQQFQLIDDLLCTQSFWINFNFCICLRILQWVATRNRGLSDTEHECLFLRSDVVLSRPDLGLEAYSQYLVCLIQHQIRQSHYVHLFTPWSQSGCLAWLQTFLGNFLPVVYLFHIWALPNNKNGFEP